MASSARPTSRAPGTPTRVSPSAGDKSCPCPPTSTTSSGRVPRRGRRTATTSCTTTGTGSRTGEICNNGTHEIDVARWVLGVDYPTSVVSTGARFHFADDWEFPDTNEATFEFAGGRSIIWQGQSCNGLQLYGRGRGTTILGTQGSVVVDRDGYVVYDLKNKVVKEVRGAEKVDSLNTLGDDWLTQLHVNNFVSAVRTGAKLTAPVEDGAKTGMLCHLGTIAHQVGRKLRTNPANGHIIDDAEAAKLWSREYDPRWKPVV
jgi:predicted dehydrogenase